MLCFAADADERERKTRRHSYSRRNDGYRKWKKDVDEQWWWYHNH